MSTVPGQYRTEEKVLWEGYPSMRTLIPKLIALFIVFALAFALAMFVIPAFAGGPLPTIAFLVGGAVFLVLVIGMVLKVLIQTRMTRYRITTERLFIEHGILNKRTDELELERYKDIFLNQTFFDRLVGCGDIKIVTGDATSPTVNILNVADPVTKKEMIRATARERQAHLHIVRREEI